VNTFKFPFHIFTKRRRDSLMKRQFHNYLKAAQRSSSYERISAKRNSIPKWVKELRTMERFLAAGAHKQEEPMSIAKATPVVIDSG
jgi:hypothetical protein